jgi:hypothetical protein
MLFAQNEPAMAQLDDAQRAVAHMALDRRSGLAGFFAKFRN